MTHKDLTFEVFERIFRENIQKRSRTAKGVSDTTSSSTKRKLLLEGDALRKQVERNTETLITSVWNSAHKTVLSANAIRNGMEKWHEINNWHLQDPKAYKADLENLRELAEQMRNKYGRDYRINHRYRTWSVSYVSLNIQPIDLEFYMDEFYTTLSHKILEAARYDNSQAHVLAFADLMIDGEIHPWNDACGRSATAAVMWLSLLVSTKEIPVFGERDEHHKSIHNLEEHTAYFEKCLNTFRHHK